MQTIKKIKQKAFTLVEMLIVIVIIWLLMSALIPKIAGMQAKGRDVARKANLNSINTSLVAYQTDKWVYPVQAMSGTNPYSTVDGVSWYLLLNMTQIPKDPSPNRTCPWINWNATPQRFMYTPIKRWWISNASSVLMACTEEGGSSSNFVYNSTSTDAGMVAWVISTGINFNWLSQLRCDSIDVKAWATASNNTWATPCSAPTNSDVLRYVMIQ